MKGADLTLEESLDWIRQYAEDSRLLAAKVIDWKMEHLRVAARLSIVVDPETPQARLFLCHRSCAPYAHFHGAVDVDDQRVCQRCFHLKVLHLHEIGQCVPGTPCTCTEFVSPPRAERPFPDSPGYWDKNGWVGTGCRKHDLDPCNVCDGE